MKAVQWLLTVLLVLLGGLFSLLVLGAYSNMTSDAPLWLRSIGSLESVLSSSVGNYGLSLFTRALLLTVLASALFGLAAYIKPRR